MSQDRIPFNGLTLAEQERLEMLAEEAAEAVQAVTKVLRHGFASYNPTQNTGLLNRGHLEKEIGDFLGIMDEMIARGDVSEAVINDFRKVKWVNARRYTHHQ